MVQISGAQVARGEGAYLRYVTDPETFCAPRRCAVMRGQSELYLSVLGMQVYSFGLIPVIFLNTREKYS